MSTKTGTRIVGCGERLGRAAMALSAALALALAGCGGGGSGGGSGGAAAAAPAAPVSNPVLAPASYSLALDVKSAQLAIGRTLTVTAVVVDQNGNDVTGNTSFAWSSGAPSIAAVVASTTKPDAAMVTGMATGSAAIQAVATVKTSDGTNVQLAPQSAAITVDASLVSYALALSTPLLQLTDGQSLPVKATLLTSDGADISGSAHDWAWASATSGVQVSASQSAATLLGVNKSDTAAVTGIVSVSVTAPNGAALAGQILVTVLKNTSFTYRLELLQGGRAGVPTNAVAVLNGYPQTVGARVTRNDGTDATADFDGTWTYAPASPTLAVNPEPATRNATIATTLANGLGPVQSVLGVTAASTKIGAMPRASLTVTEQPTWALVYNGPQPLVLLKALPLTTPVAATLKFHGVDTTYLGCTGWQWTSTGNVTLSPTGIDSETGVTPLDVGAFTVTATCQAGSPAQPLSLTVGGTVR